MSDAESTGIPDTGRSTAADAAAGKPSRARRIAHVLVALLVFVVVPMVLVGALVGEFGAGAMATGLVLGVAGSKIGGTRRMALLAPAIGVAGGLGAFTAYDWWWVALLATVGVIAGAGIRFGWMPALLMVPYAATPVSTGTDAVIYGAIVAIATGYGIVLAHRFGAPTLSMGTANRWRSPLWSRSSLASPSVPAPPLVWRWDGPSRTGFPNPCSSWCSTSSLGSETRSGGRRSAPRSASPLRSRWRSSRRLPGSSRQSGPSRSSSRSHRPSDTGSCTACTRSLWCCFSPPPGHVGYEAEERGVQILVGIGILVVGLAIVTALAQWLRERYPQPELAPGGPSALTPNAATSA